jgi:hypothetical protein
MAAAKTPAEAAAIDYTERRKSPRLRCSGSAELRAEGSGKRLWGTLTNISLHGCYVETNTTFPTGTKVHVVLKSFGIRIEAPGKVRAPGTVRDTHPFMGMGIGFAELEPDQEAKLKQLIDALSGRIAVSNSTVMEEYGKRDALASADQQTFAKDTLAFVDQRAFLEEITKFFQKNQLLNREEFYQIAKRVCRS